MNNENRTPVHCYNLQPPLASNCCRYDIYSSIFWPMYYATSIFSIWQNSGLVWRQKNSSASWTALVRTSCCHIADIRISNDHAANKNNIKHITTCWYCIPKSKHRTEGCHIYNKICPNRNFCFQVEWKIQQYFESSFKSKRE